MKMSLLAVALVVWAAPVAAQTADTTSSPPFFTKRDAFMFAGFAAGTIALMPLDKDLAHTLQDPDLQENKLVRRGARFFKFMGQPAPQFIGVGLYGVGKLTGSSRIQKLGLHGLEAMLLTNVTVTSIKFAVGRARPFVQQDSAAFDFEFGRGFKGRDYQSFPSGHAATAFAVASAATAETSRWIDESHASPLWKIVIGATMFGGATFVGFSRVYHDQHWASDVIAGATIGTFAGIKTVSYNYRNPKNIVERALISATVVPTEGQGMYIVWSLPLN